MQQVPNVLTCYIVSMLFRQPSNDPCAAAAAGTITVNDSLDLLAEFMGCGDSVAAVTNKVHDQHRLKQL
jgi:hypothetical protein